MHHRINKQLLKYLNNHRWSFRDEFIDQASWSDDFEEDDDGTNEREKDFERKGDEEKAVFLCVKLSLAIHTTLWLGAEQWLLRGISQA